MAKTKFTRPEDIKALDNDALAKLIEEALAHGQELAGKDDAELTKEEIEELDSIGSFLDEAEVERNGRETEAKAKADKLAALRAKVAPREKADDGKDGDDGGNDDDGDDGENGGDGGDGQEQQEQAPDVQEVLQSASLKRGTASRAARRGPGEQKPVVKKSSGRVRSAAEYAGFTAGQEFGSLLEASKAITARLNGLPSGYQKDTQLRYGALQFDMPADTFNQDNRDFRNDTELFYAASREARLEGKSLTAAGGWGAPSERALDFCELESIDGLYTGPEVTITRGGIQYTKGPSFADVFNSSTGFWDMTEAVAEAGVVQKTSLRPSVPGFIEKRLDAVGVMMEAGLLLRAGWPELVERYARLLLTAHKVKMSQKAISQIQAYTGNAISVTNGFGNAMDLAHVVELVAIGERQRNNMSENQTLEALIPAWAKAVIRADLAQRSGVDTLSVTDAQIDALFTARNVRVQWLRGWQNLTIDASGIATSYPDTIEVIMYPAGTFVRGVADVIQLDTIYDSVNLKKNDYVHLFVEQGTLMANPCGDGRRISLPFLANGRRANVSDINDDLFNTPEA
jgi:hypothetical protein